MQACGLDTSPRMVDMYNAKATSLGLSTKMAARCLDVTDEAAVASARAAGHVPPPGGASHVSIHMTLHHVEHVPVVLRALLRPETGRLLITDILKTPTSGRLFHAHHVQHTVAYPGGFAREQLEGMLAEAGLQLVSFKPHALEVNMEVPREASGHQGGGHGEGTGGEAPEKEMVACPIFLAVVARPSD